MSFEKILIVEDERHLLSTLMIALEKLGARLFSATTLSLARSLLKEAQPELVILDRNLPDGDGFDFCSEIRTDGYLGAILILTASGQTEDRVEGLNRGADDYLPKPFSWEELEARVRALGRRKAHFHSIQEPLWEVDASNLRVFGPKGWVKLTALEFRLACTLIQSPNQIIARADLLKNVWGFTFLPQTRTVDFFLSRLRKYFEPTPEHPIYFLTIRGLGYQFKP